MAHPTFLHLVVFDAIGRTRDLWVNPAHIAWTEELCGESLTMHMVDGSAVTIDAAAWYRGEVWRYHRYHTCVVPKWYGPLRNRLLRGMLAILAHARKLARRIVTDCRLLTSGV